ncbi:MULTISPECIES: hypothetical protein [Pseudomonadota]|uniref:hypothetical protein n=1 Tax=Pseudomonadota TaxID=1224 RepID=UPI00261596AD|nr:MULTISPECIES: hypothetical protein [Pseudomonadota]
MVDLKPGAWRWFVPLCTAFWLAFFMIAVPAAVRHMPSWWWLDVRAVRVDSQTTLVTIDQTIARDYTGDVAVLVRQVSGKIGAALSTCGGGRTGIKNFKGMPWPAHDIDLNWFMDAPPNAGCDLAPAEYVADFRWTYAPWWALGMKFETRASSNIFRVS